ncbi:MAG: glycosyltransferase family 2 protein [Lachnospiraceae bacterium]|nr:glycosyltransferase family 2 protein [Lachnospiraceae bacterium]
MRTKLYMVIPCYNEEKVLPITVKLFAETLDNLAQKGKISDESRILFVDDGSKDDTWKLITEFSKKDIRIRGIRLSRNRGHQNALLAGLMEVKDEADITITMDCDGQDDLRAVEAMMDAYHEGCEIVYGVRNDRSSDSVFKRTTAQGFYKLMNHMGAEAVYNHADFRLLSVRVIKELAQFKETNLFLRGMIPLVGFKSTAVYYERCERVAGKSKYSLKKMLGLAFDGITSFSIQPLRLIMGAGCLVALLSFIGVIWAVVTEFMGKTVAGWASMTCIICFVGGVQLICLGIMGEYIGKIYMEVKGRPRYIVEKRTEEKNENEQ